MTRLLSVFTFIILTMLTQAQTPHTPLRQLIPSTWEFRQANTENWHPTAVPVSVHTALLQNRLIDDPFYGANEEKLQWIEQEDWEFRCQFDVDSVTLARTHVELAFQGLDTYAHVYLNDSLILESNNMFRGWQVDVKKYLKPTGNHLHIYFESPVKKAADDWQNLGYELPAGIRTMTRKAQFHYGWDWGPRFVGCGILQLPELVAWNDFIIEKVFVNTHRLYDNQAILAAHFRYRSDVGGEATISFKEGKIKSIEKRTILPGVHEDSITYTIKNPKLWWCAGMGEPNLYDFSLEINLNGHIVEKKEIRTGIRTIELVTKPDAAGETFYFKLNGKPVFTKGANYIPQDIFQDRVRPEQYKRLLDDATAANMNMLRVWGGGIYEDDLFYQLCDARGIMVWQDFMYACAMYPGSGSFLKNAAAEAYEQIERLRQHPCIALWCGNNENNEAWHNWGWQMQFNEAQRAQIWRDYKTLFNDLLPTYVTNYGGGVPYWESSPRYGRANPKSLTEGDAHYWGVWHDEEPFEVLNKKVPRYMSEFGFQSFPDWATIESFSQPEDRELESHVMLTHQKHPRGNALIAEYLKRDYRVPNNFEDFVYISQLLQAEGMRTGLEAHRRNKPYCMGTLYWQLNDVWPVASWSSIDYYGRWKAMHYYVRDVFSPVAVLPIVEDGILKIFASSDLPDDTVATIRVRALSLEGKSLSDATMPDIAIKPDSSRMIWQGYLKTMLDKQKEEDAVVEIVLKNNSGETLNRRLFYLVPPRKLALPRTRVNLQVKAVNNGYQLTLESSKLAKNVYLRSTAPGRFSDNYFDLLPGEHRTIIFETETILDAPDEVFFLKHLQETYGR